MHIGTILEKKALTYTTTCLSNFIDGHIRQPDSNVFTIDLLDPPKFPLSIADAFVLCLVCGLMSSCKLIMRMDPGEHLSSEKQIKRRLIYINEKLKSIFKRVANFSLCTETSISSIFKKHIFGFYFFQILKDIERYSNTIHFTLA
jgi:hypothetical protein